MAREDWSWQRIRETSPHAPSWDDVLLTNRTNGLADGYYGIAVEVDQLDDFIAWVQEIRDAVRERAR